MYEIQVWLYLTTPTVFEKCKYFCFCAVYSKMWLNLFEDTQDIKTKNRNNSLLIASV